MTTYDARTTLDVLLQEMKSDNTARAADTLLLAKLTVSEYAEDYWTNDQRFEATMVVYKGMVHAHQWEQDHSLEREKVQRTEISRQTVEWTNRPIKVELIRE